MRIRSKLAVALIVPLLALAGLSWVSISASNKTADEAAERAQVTEGQVALGTATIGPGGVLTAIQNERNITVANVAGYGDILGEDQTLDGSRATTDAALDDFRKVIAESDSTVRTAYEEALVTLDSVKEIRTQTDDLMADREANNIDPMSESSTIENAEIFDLYTNVLTGVFDVNDAVVVRLDDEELRGGARFVNDLGRANELQARLMRYVGLSITTGVLTDDPASLILASEAKGELAAIRNALETSGPTRYRELAATTFSDPRLEPSVDTVERAMAGQPLSVADLTSEEAIAWSDVYRDHRTTASVELAEHAEELIADAEAERDDAESQARIVALGAIGVVVLALVLALAAARSIARPLRRLVGDAENMAGTALPNAVQAILDAPLGEDVQMPELAQVSPEGGAEIAEVAAALNTVQDSAAGLAIEQAILRRNISDSFVNLGRRNQNLLSRQLDSITEMEREESDPASLEKLFTLDHLATRMRRNAESLLLLAGLEPHRQWSAPVALIDVIRGALGEVEDYSRVEITRFDEAMVSGTNAADLTHLVAELLENALHFSPPGRNVVISGARRENGYTLAIVDNGIGMEKEAMDQANVRLSGGESFTVAPSRYLGHYVVGIQASRLGTPVVLQDTPVGGVTAMIDVTALLADDAEVPAQASDDSPEDLEAEAVELAEVIEPDDVPVVKVDGSPVAASNGFPNGNGNGNGNGVHAQPVAVAAAPESYDADAAVEAPTEPRPVEPVAAAPSGAYAPAGAAVEDTTPSGYRKRVRGTHTPRTDVISARGDQGAESTTSDAQESSADRMRSMLSGLQSGTERAQAETQNRDDQRDAGR